MPKGIGYGPAAMKKLQRADRVGGRGVNRQNARARAAGAAGAAREATRRVGEYKRGKVNKSDGTNDSINRRSQENLK
jgi:hypothetical protein